MRKDYYELLQVFPDSSSDEIKRSYRKLALRYHPDRNPQNAEASLHFRDLAEAYAVLSDPVSRYTYDRENGFSSLNVKTRPTPLSIMSDAGRLRRYVYNISIFHPDQHALLYHIKKILSDTNLQLLQEFNEPGINRQILADLQDASRFLHFRYLPEVIERFNILAVGDEISRHNVIEYAQYRKNRHLWDRYFPFVVFLLTVIFCLLIYAVST